MDDPKFYSAWEQVDEAKVIVDLFLVYVWLLWTLINCRRELIQCRRGLIQRKESNKSDILIGQ